LRDPAEAVSQEVAFDKWKRSLGELGWGDDERLTRQIFDEVKQFVSALFSGYVLST